MISVIGFGLQHVVEFGKERKRLDPRPVLSASESVGRHPSAGDIVSGLVLSNDFFVGHSPERINREGQGHRVHDIVKVTNRSTPETAALVDELYRSIPTVGIHRAPSIKVAAMAALESEMRL